MMAASPISNTLSNRAQTLEASKIREIAELGMRQPEVIPLWFGEGAWPTNPLFVEAAVESLKAGNHRYQQNNGSPGLRDEICRYSNNLFGTHLRRERITVTPSGMQGLALAAQILVSPGDRIVTIAPGWPNIVGVFQAAGALNKTVPITPQNGRWTLDMEALLTALTPDTKAIIINSPNNPTGWTMSADEQTCLLDHCRKQGIWIVADDVYSRLYRHDKNAPSFLAIADPEDLLISVNSFSKSWSMTGWRLGWMVAPATLEAKLGQLTEFNTCSTAGFIQEAGIIALREGEAEISQLKQRINAGYELTAAQLAGFEKVEFIEPDGAFYCFFKVDGLNDSLAAAKQIMQETKVGLAPGVAFGPHGEGYLRLCYAQPLDVLEQAYTRLAGYLSQELPHAE